MKRAMFLLVSLAILTLAVGPVSAQILFYADFENTSGPNDPAKWNANNVTPGKNVFEVANGRLIQTSNGCSESTKTTVPADGSSWTDYTVGMDVWDKDNDTFSILFRYTDPDHYYNFTVGAGDFNNTWFLGDSTAKETDCFDGGAPALATGANGVTIDETGGTGYTIAARVSGDKIELFFGEKVDMINGELPPKVGELNDSTHTMGTAGLHTGSNPAEFDNFLVYGPTGPTAVEPAGKLATVWGTLKALPR